VHRAVAADGHDDSVKLGLDELARQLGRVAGRGRPEDFERGAALPQPRLDARENARLAAVPGGRIPDDADRRGRADSSVILRR
jgi:hypothetical protein